MMTRQTRSHVVNCLTDSRRICCCFCFCDGAEGRARRCSYYYYGAPRTFLNFPETNPQTTSRHRRMQWVPHLQAEGRYRRLKGLPPCPSHVHTQPPGFQTPPHQGSKQPRSFPGDHPQPSGFAHILYSWPPRGIPGPLIILQDS